MLNFFVFNEPKKFDRIRLAPTNIIDIADCKDTDGNRWYEVDYLAQDTVYTEVKQAEAADPLLSPYEEEVPYILSLRRVPRRFTKKQCQKGVKGFTMRSSCAPYKDCQKGGKTKKQRPV